MLNILFSTIFIAELLIRLICEIMAEQCYCVSLCVDYVLMSNEVTYTHKSIVGRREVYVSRLSNYVCITCHTWSTYNWGRSRPKIIDTDKEQSTFKK